MAARSSAVDAFLARYPTDVREALEALRAAIAAAAPDAEEAISYGVPAFKYRGRSFVSFGAGKKHCSFYVQSPAVMAAHQDDLAGYSQATGTVHFSPDAPLPTDLVNRLVRARIAEIDATTRKA